VHPSSGHRVSLLGGRDSKIISTLKPTLSPGGTLIWSLNAPGNPDISRWSEAIQSSAFNNEGGVLGGSPLLQAKRFLVMPEGQGATIMFPAK
jgi:hypothetical protein